MPYIIDLFWAILHLLWVSLTSIPQFDRGICWFSIAALHTGIWYSYYILNHGALFFIIDLYVRTWYICCLLKYQGTRYSDQFTLCFIITYDINAPCFEPFWRRIKQFFAEILPTYRLLRWRIYLSVEYLGCWPSMYHMSLLLLRDYIRLSHIFEFILDIIASYIARPAVAWILDFYNVM